MAGATIKDITLYKGKYPWVIAHGVGVVFQLVLDPDGQDMT